MNIRDIFRSKPLEVKPLEVKALPKTGPLAVVSTKPANIPIYSEMTVRKANRDGYKLSLYVYRAVRTIIQSSSGIPWIVVDKKSGEYIPNHPLELVFKNPNPVFSGQDMMEFLVAHLKLVGNALWQPVIVQSQFKEFWPVMPDMVAPIPSDNVVEWIKGWQVTDQLGRRVVKPPETFLHFMEIDPGNPYWGIGPLMAAARTVDCDNEAQDTQKVSMQNRGVTDGAFIHETPMTEEQFQEARRQVRENYLDKSRRREPWVLGAGTKWQSMALSPVDMDYIASRLSNKQDIAAAFGLDPWWLGDRSHSTYNNVEEARKALYEDVIIPLLDDLRAAFNLKTAPLYGDDIFITYDLSGIPVLRSDMGKKVDQANKLWGMGVPFNQINDKLELGFEEFPGWDKGYLPFSVSPVGESGVVEQPEPAPVEQPVNTEQPAKYLNIDTEEQKAAYWKRVDSQRLGWANVAANKFESILLDEAKKVAKAVESGGGASSVENTLRGNRKAWENTMAAVLYTVGLHSGELVADNLGMKPKSAKADINFPAFQALLKKWVAHHGAESVRTIEVTRLDELKKVIAAGIDENLTNAQLAQNIRGFYTDRASFMAQRIARTETSAAAGFGQRQMAKTSGIVKQKKWVSSRDDRVRDSHAAIDGQITGFDTPYSNGLMYPGDPSGNGSEVIQCRCVEAYITAGE